MTISLADNEVHIWRTDLEQVSESLLEPFRALMNREELERNHRFIRWQGQLTHAVTRALVRTVLSNYADVDSRDWQFIAGEHGKPELLNPPLPLRFNVSHSARYIVCAVTLKQDIGIDIEHTARNNDVRSIADRYFSAEEVSALFQLPDEVQVDRFFDYWTLKEAYMKARGEGISLGLGNFSFHLDNPERIRLSVTDKIQDTPEGWQFRLFHPADAYRMALAVKRESPFDTVQIRQFETLPLQGSFFTKT